MTIYHMLLGTNTQIYFNGNDETKRFITLVPGFNRAGEGELRALILMCFRYV
jgi:hypothetical protein